MFNPNSFFPSRSLPNAGMFSRIPDSILVQSHRPITIITPDTKRTRWDQPLSLVGVLYRKFNLPLPEELRQNDKKQPQYPASLLEYIKRCYERCSNEAENKRMEGLLRKIIQQAEPRLNEIDWDHFEIPQIPKITVQPIAKPMVIEDLIKVIEPVIQPKIEKKQWKPNSVEVRATPTVSTTVSVSRFQPAKQALKQTKKVPEIPTRQTVYPLQAVVQPTKVLTKAQEKAAKTMAKIKAKQIIAPSITQDTKRYERLQRFKGEPIKKLEIVQDDEFDESMADDWQIVGTSQNLQKQYLRITGMPDPKTVRPLQVLKKVLVFLRDKYAQGETYQYIIWQFRSLRQDLTIQHIKNSFTVEVYEENSRISLECGDLGQYNQCQSALWDLYRNGIYHQKSNMMRFIGYQLLSLILEQKDQQFQNVLVQLTTQQLESKQIQDVLRLRRLLRTGDYPQFFRFYHSQDPIMQGLIKQYIDKYRALCVATICKTFGQKVKLNLLANMLGDDIEELEELILEMGGVIKDGEFYLKQSNESIQGSEYLMQRKKNVYLE